MKDWLQRDNRTVWHPYTPEPHVGPKALLTKAKGAYVYDVDGNKRYDGTASWWCNIHGHCNERMGKALYEQSQKLDQVLFSPHSHPVAIELAEAIGEKLPEGMNRVFFSDDGSTAVEAALKLCVQYWVNQGVRGRNRILSLEHAYHGDTLGAVSASHVDQFHHYFEGMLPKGYRIPVPYAYRRPKELGEAEYIEKCKQAASKIIESHKDSIAGLIVEPLILGAGGMIIYPADYLEHVVRECRRHGILVVFDEVFTGFGRTGSFFAWEKLSERPDVICLSKGLTGGMLPLGLTVAADWIYDAFRGGPEKTFYNGHTFTANGLSCAVALESLKLFEENQWILKNQKLIEVMASQSERFADLPHVGDVRQIGMIWVTEVVKEKSSREVYQPANGPGWKIATELWDRGVWIRPLNQLIYLVPPYCTTAEELTGVLDQMYDVMKEERFYR